MSTAKSEHHNPLDFDHDGRLSKFELLAGAAIGVGVLAVGVVLGLVFIAVC